jgi:hypothetical protein
VKVVERKLILGFILDPDIVALNERYVAGELTSEELTAAIKKAVD